MEATEWNVQRNRITGGGMPLRFYEYTSGTVVCEDCLNEDLRRTNNGEYTGDEAVSIGMFQQIETPAQCDSCLEQSDDYDDVLEEE
jgi:hypothetical protein